MTEPRRQVGRARVATVEGDPRGSIPQRLQWVFDKIVLPGRGPFSAAEVARWINDQPGGSISAVYLLKILRGEREKPSLDKLEWIGRFFGVNPEWWVAEDPPELDVAALVAQLQLRALQVDPLLRVDPHELLQKIARLSPAQQLAIEGIVDNLLRAEGGSP